MRRLLIWIALLAASVYLGLLIVKHPGYVFIVAKPWMVQMPLWFACIVWLLIFAVFFLIVDSLDRLQFWWYRVKNWWSYRQEKMAYSKTQHGLALLVEGRYSKAERLLLQGVNQNAEPLMNYLGAARAAHELKADDRADQYLRIAHERVPDAELAIGITQAEFEIERNHLERASLTLNRLRQISSRHPSVLAMLEKVYMRLGDWQALRDLLPELRKAKVLNNEEATKLEKHIYGELLKAAGKHDRTALENCWYSMPRAVRKDPDIVYIYVKQLKSFGETAQIEDLIRYVLKYEWHPELMKIYSTLSFENINRQLVIAGAWLKMYGQKPEITLFLGKLCMHIQLWGKAKDYFESCLEQGPNPEAALLYGKLLEQLHDKDEAMLKYREVLQEMT